MTKSGINKRLARITHGAFPDILCELLELNLRDAGIFLMLTCGDGKWRRVDNASSTVAFFVDLDGAPLEPVMSASI